MKPNDLLTVYDVSVHLTIGEETVRRWLRSGRLRGIRLSRKACWRIRARDLYDFLDSTVISSGAYRGVPFYWPRPWHIGDESDIGDEDIDESADEVNDELGRE